MTSIPSLLLLAEKATRADRELDVDIAWALEPERYRAAYWNGRVGKPGTTLPLKLDVLGRLSVKSNCPSFTGSVDSALALLERLRPGWKWGVASVAVKTGEKSPEGYPRYGTGFRAHVTEVSALRPMPSVADAPTAPLAILIATLRSLIQEHKDGQS